MFKNITMAADQVVEGHSSGWLGQGDHRKVIGEQHEPGCFFSPVFGDAGVIERASR